MSAVEIKVAKPLDITHEDSMKAGAKYHRGEGKIFLNDTFYDELIWEQIIVGQDKRPIYRVWKYYKDTIPCISCAKTSDMVYNIQSVGVYGRCLWCNVTVPVMPMDMETGDNLAELLSESVVSLEEAYSVLNRTGQKAPLGLPALRQRRKRRHS
jgi:hypothetical protein